MRSPFLNNISPELYLDNNATIEFKIPFNIGGVLISLKNESYKPVWITSDLLRISDTQEFLKRKTINDIDFLINNSIIPNYTISDFRRSLRETYIKNKTVFGYFSERNSIKGYKDEINLTYRPVFIPIYRKNLRINYIFFYLEKYQSKKPTLEIHDLKINIEREERKIKALFQLSNKSIIEINNKLEIEKYNSEASKLFPEINRKKKKLFLDLWNLNNKERIVWALQSSKHLIEQEIYFFEEINKSLQKLKLKIINIANTSSSEMNFLILIENLNEEQRLNKELTRKSIFIQTINDLSNEIETNNDNFIDRCIKNLILFFDFKEIFLFPFKEKGDDLIIKILIQNRTINPSTEEYDAFRQTFQNIAKRSIKRISINELKKNYRVGLNLFSGTNNLFGVPLYNGDIQIGAMVYSSEREKLDLDETQLLYSLSTIIFKYYSNYQTISKYKSQLSSLNTVEK